MIILWRKCETMKVMKVEQPQINNSHLALTTLAGIAGGSAARYIMPTKSELSSVFNKNVDTFVSSAAARSKDRSALKYAGIGAVIALGAKALYNIFKKDENNDEDIKRTYTKAEIIADIPDIAYSYVWGDELN